VRARRRGAGGRLELAAHRGDCARGAKDHALQRLEALAARAARGGGVAGRGGGARVGAGGVGGRARGLEPRLERGLDRADARRERGLDRADARLERGLRHGRRRGARRDGERGLPRRDAGLGAAPRGVGRRTGLERRDARGARRRAGLERLEARLGAGRACLGEVGRLVRAEARDLVAERERVCEVARVARALRRERGG
jgi:hypothetical protein